MDILGHEMAVSKLARMSGDWQAYASARDNALHLVLTHRIEDEVSRFRQVAMACTGWQNWGEDARELIMKRLKDAFTQGIDRGESPHDLIVRMQRIPRSGVTAELVSEFRRGDGETCITFLFAEDGQLPEDLRAVGDDAAAIAEKLTNRDWADFLAPLLAISPGEPRDEVMDAARKSLRRTLSAVAARPAPSASA